MGLAISVSDNRQLVGTGRKGAQRNNEQILIPLLDRNISTLPQMKELLVKNFSEGEKVFGNFTSTWVKLAAQGQNLAF